MKLDENRELLYKGLANQLVNFYLKEQRRMESETVCIWGGWNWEVWIVVPSLSLTGCVTLGESLLNLSDIDLPHLKTAV